MFQYYWSLGKMHGFKQNVNKKVLHKYKYQEMNNSDLSSHGPFFDRKPKWLQCIAKIKELEGYISLCYISKSMWTPEHHTYISLLENLFQSCGLIYIYLVLSPLCSCNSLVSSRKASYEILECVFGKLCNLVKREFVKSGNVVGWKGWKGLGHNRYSN